MAQPAVVSGSELLVLIGDGSTPTENFESKCMINLSRSIEFSADTQQDDVPDCEDPDAPAWKTTDIVSFGCTIQGAGYFDALGDDFFFDWLASGEAKNIRFKVNKPGAGTYAGAFKCSQFQISGDRKAKAQNSITLLADGPVTRAANASA